MWPTRACGTSSSTASSMPSPARSTGTTTMSAPTRRPSAGPSGVSTVTLGRRHVAQRFGRQQHADARRGAAERARRRALVAQFDAAHRARADGRRGGPARLHTIQFLHTMRALLRSIVALALAAAVVRRAAQSRTPRRLARRHRRHRHHRERRAAGPVARRRRHRRHRHRRRRLGRTAIAARYTARADHRRARPDRAARADQHPHPRADGACFAAWPTIWR